MSEEVIFSIKKGDLLPALRLTLTGADGAAADLSEAESLVLKMAKWRDGTVVIGAGEVTPIDAAEGVVEYDWQAGNTDLVGIFEVEVKANMPDAEPLHFPNDSNIFVVVYPTVGDGA